jgi:hypothetical protein
MSMNAGVHACVHVLVCTHNTMHMLPIRRPVSASRRISSMGSKLRAEGNCIAACL